MQKTFQKWLLVFVAIAFVITFVVSFQLQTKMAKQNASLLIKLKIEDVKKQLTINKDNIKLIRSETDSTSITKAHCFAWMLKLSPDICSNYDLLMQSAHKLGVDEVDIIDGKGILTACSEKSYIGYDMASQPQSAQFLPILKDPTLEIVQEPQPKGIDKTMMQYAGVARLDAPGFVQIAYRPQRLEDAMKLAAIENLAPSFRIGQNGNILIIQSNKIVSIANTNYFGKDIREYGITTDLTPPPENAINAIVEGENVLCSFEHFAGYTILGILPKDEMYLSRNNNSLQIILFNLVLFGTVFLLISFLVQKIVISGIYKVNNSLHKITCGNLDEKVHVDTSKEFVSLSHGINTTVAALKKAIAETAARLDAELEFAKAIQLASLPRVFPPYPNRKEFDIYAQMFTAKEVGGDFYDFFFTDETHLVIMVADVSGKGIPAALFMMTIKPLIRSYAEAGNSAAEVFTKTNHQLFESSNSKMFVTAFMAILDTNTGIINYVNAGHNPPLIRRSTGYEFIRPRPGLVLGGVDDIQYKQASFQLNINDILFLYTDGVTEALNPEQQLFSNERLLDCLNKTQPESSLEEILNQIHSDIEIFAHGAQQSDDITMLALKYKGCETHPE